MKNRDYWRRRFEILEASAAEKGQEYFHDLDREYRITMREVESDLARWYQRFAENNGLAFSEAKQWLNAGQLAEFKWSVAEYIRFGKENALTGKWMKQLENASARVHISRLEALQLEIQQKVEVLYGKQLDGIGDLARKIYTEGYYHTAFEVQRGFNIGWEIPAIDQRQLDRVISKPWTADGQTFSGRIWKNKTVLSARLQTTLSQSLLKGSHPNQAITGMMKDFGTSRYQAERLIMTESAYFSSVGDKAAFEELGVEQYEIVATLDLITSTLCQSLDGEVLPLKNYEAGVTAPPFHPNCRTTTAPYFNDNYGERAARGADGQTYYVPSDMTYKEWYNQFVLPNESKSAIIGIKVATGATVKNVKTHLVDRLIERGFGTDDIINALEKPLHISDVKINDKNEPSIQFIGDKVTVAYNPETNAAISGWKTGKAKRRKYGDKE